MWLAAVLVLLTPLAGASDTSGVLAAFGPINLPEGTRVRGDAEMLYLGNPTAPLGLHAFEMKAERLDVMLYMANKTEAQTPASLVSNPYVQSPKTLRQYTLHDVTVAMDGATEAGFLGIIRQGGTASLEFTAGTAPLINVSDTRTFGHGSSSTEVVTQVQGEPTPVGRDEPMFRHLVEGPHLILTSGGHVTYQGALELKVMGMPLTFAARENTTYIATGNFPRDDFTVRTTMMVWAVLIAENATVTTRAAVPWTVAAPKYETEWSGVASFTGAGGEVTVGKESYPVARGDPMRLDGDLAAAVTPSREQETLVALLAFSGDLRRTDIGTSSYVPAPQPGVAGGFPSILLLVGVAVVGGASAGAYYLRRRTKPQPAVPAPVPLTPSVAAEYYVGLAEEAIQAEDHAKALHWIQLAREAVPTSADVATTMAFILGELGQHEEALEAYAEASRLDPSDGEADVNAARLALRCGKPLDEVEELVVRALERSPEFVLDVEEDVEFQALALRPAFQDALERAWWRWGGEQRGSPE